jgi:hypothetical protein
MVLHTHPGQRFAEPSLFVTMQRLTPNLAPRYLASSQILLSVDHLTLCCLTLRICCDTSNYSSCSSCRNLNSDEQSTEFG